MHLEAAMDFDADAFANAFQFNMTEDDLTELMMSMSGTQSASYDNNLQQLGYADFSHPSSISIYPKDFDNKEKVVEVLDHYNQQMEDEGKEEQVISYTDIVGTMMSSVTTIINTISYVLIAFVAISLIVSSIMIGVITYISVLERKKEIGILRAIGASKGNISQVFNAETFIIGLCAGLIGIGLTLLMLIPGNMLIHALAGNNQVSAILPAAPAIVLILLSVVLTLLGGLIPSRKAAKSDPVTALRRYRNKKKKAYILAALILCIVIAAVAVFAISRMAGKEQTSKNQTEVKALVINAEKVDVSKLKDLIESAGKINQSVYTDETVNTLNQAKEEAEETIQGKPNQEEVEDSYLNLVNAIQSLQKK